MIRWQREIWHWLILLIIFALSAWAWGRAPDRVPVHWDFHGNVDRYGSKAEGLLIGPAVSVGVYLLMLFIPLIDPGRRNYRKFEQTYHSLRLLVLLMMLAISGIASMAAAGHQVDVGTWIVTAIGALFIAIGNMMGKIRPNFFVGVRTPWTLTSKRSWVKTHRVAGWVFIGSGILFLVAAWVHQTWAFIAALAVNMAGVIGAVVYSYLVWRSDPDRSFPLANEGEIDLEQTEQAEPVKPTDSTEQTERKTQTD